MGLLDLITTPRSSAASGLFGHLQDENARPPDGPNLGDRLMAGFQSFAGSHALLPALLNGVQGFTSGHRNDPVGHTTELQEQRHAMLVKHGFDPLLATSIASDPELTRRVVMHIVTSRDDGAQSPTSEQ